MAPTIQTTYPNDIPVAYAGAIADEQADFNLISRTVEDSGGIAFGLAVIQGTDDDGIVVGDGTGFLGVTVRDQSVDPADPNEFAYQDSARIMTKGTIWIANDGGVSAGDPVSVGADGALGTGGSVEVAGARWDTTATDGNLAILRLG